MKIRNILVALWLIALAAGLSTLSLGAAEAQTTGSTRYEGVLNVVWGDPRPGASGGATLFSLRMADGTTRLLTVPPEQQNVAISYFGQRVAVFGRLQQRAAGTAPSAIIVDRVQALSPARLEQQSSAAAVTGTRRVLYILLKYSGDAQEPHATTFYKELTNPRTPPPGSLTPATLNGFFYKSSWGRFQWRADVAGAGGLNPTQWFTLPKTRSEYVPCAPGQVCADLNGIANDGMTLAANAGINLSVYDNVNFVLNNDLDCCAWGGGTFFNGKSYGATWEPPWGQNAGIYVHEMGHSLGLPHSGWVYHAYDSPWDMMSSGSNVDTVQCGTYSSANRGGAASNIYCGKPGAGYIAAHKQALGWLPAANQVVMNTVGARTVTLAANGSALGAAIKMIKICMPGFLCQGSTGRYLTVESRINDFDFEKGMPSDGVLIHNVRRDRPAIGAGNPCIEPFIGGGWAVPIDATKGDYDSVACNSGGRVYPDYALHNALYTPGKTYSNPYLGVTVQVLRRFGSAFDVKVTKTK